MSRQFSIFRWLIAGQAISLLGSSLTGFSLGIWVYSQTDNITDFSIVWVASALPMALLSPLAGVLVDRWSRKTVLLISQLIAVLMTAVIFILYWFDALMLWHIILVTAIASASNALVLPAVSATIPLMVDKKDLTKANAWVSLAVGLVQLFAPLIAGIVLDRVGLQGVLVIDLLTFIVGVFSLVVVAIPNPEKREVNEITSVGKEMLAGWFYLTERKGLFWLTLFQAVLTFSVAAIALLVQPMVLNFDIEKQWFFSGLAIGEMQAQLAGMAMFMAGVGMLVGSVLMLVWRGPKRKVIGVLWASLLASLFCVLMPIKPNIWLVGIYICIIMAIVPVANTCTQVLLQTKLPNHFQGRIFGLRQLIFGLARPCAYVAMGFLADTIFEPGMAENGMLANSLGGLYGVGIGRGIAVLISVLGLLTIIATGVAWFYRPLRRIDTELPDQLSDNEKE